MAERLRELLERPLDPRAGRAMVALAAAIFAGLALLGVLARGGADRVTRPQIGAPTHHAGVVPSSSLPPMADRRQRSEGAQPRRRPRQDPQDQHGSAPAKRAAREVASHRALQHVPYHRRGVAVTLVGARGERAVLQVSGPTIVEARRGWHLFLRRYHDSGSAYLPRFDVQGGAGD